MSLRADPLPSDSSCPRARYREYAAGAALSPFVNCFWSQRIEAGDTNFLQRVLPDGCADILFVGDDASFVVGPATRTWIVSLPPGETVVAVRFRPGAAAALLGLPVCEILDREVPLDTLWSRTKAAELAGTVLDARSIDARLATLEQWFADRAVRLGVPDARMRAAVEKIHHDSGASLRDLEDLTGWCGRQLRRRFHEEVGYGVKTFQRVMRLQRFREMNCRAIHRPLDLAGIAAHLGYADQAHMTREVGELAGITPTALRAIAPHMQQISDPFAAAR